MILFKTIEDVQDYVDEFVKTDSLYPEKPGYFDEDKTIKYVIQRASYGDYVGSTVQMANYKCLDKEFGDLLGYIGYAYGGEALYVTVEDLWEVYQENPELVSDLFESLAALEDYPVLDEELMCEIEMELQDEAWQDNYHREMIDWLEEEELIDDDEWDYLLDEGDKCFELFRDLMDRANEYWLHEDCNWPYVNLDRVMNKMTKEDLELLLDDMPKPEPEMKIDVDSFLPKHVRES